LKWYNQETEPKQVILHRNPFGRNGGSITLARNVYGSVYACEPGMGHCRRQSVVNTLFTCSTRAVCCWQCNMSAQRSGCQWELEKGQVLWIKDTSYGLGVTR